MTNTPPYQVTDPATGEVTEKFPFATDAEVEQALAAATDAFTDGGSGRSPSGRRSSSGSPSCSPSGPPTWPP